MRTALLALCLAGCTSLGETVEYRVITRCDGEQFALPITTVVSPLPAVECARLVAERGGTFFQAAWMVLGGALACAIHDNAYRWALIVLPPWGEWMREHEMAHIAGRTHPLLSPVYLGEGC